MTSPPLSGDIMNKKAFIEYVLSNRISVSKLAELIGIDRSTMTRYLNGERTPSMKVATRIVEYTNKEITYDDIYGKDYTRNK